MNDRIIAQLINVSKYYGSGEGRVTALNHVNLSFFRGDIVVLVGLSGSGKSTLLHLLGCIDKQDEGNVIIDGIDTSSMSLEQLANLRLNKIGFVFQSFNLIPVLTAYENVELPLLFKDMDKKSIRQRVDEVLDEVGLHDRKHHYPREISGGQQQRVAIARALVSKPALILADEPTANLDSKTGAGILDLLMSLNKKEHITIVVSSHDSVVLDRIKSVVHIRDGKIMVDETALHNHLA
ncbi:MAG: ABC transporter ATP-binding protein [Chlorobium sp.]|jgi:putative ABC transport system ATP-binding protein|nr:ABC transporter ATP-binding protein [Chlorobium sp.]